MPVTYTNPAVGGDNGSWGTKANAVHDAFAAFMNGLETSIATKLAKAGDTLTGLLNLKTSTSAHLHLASAALQSLDLSAAQSFDATITAPTTFTFANPPNTTAAMSGLLLRLVNGGAFAITWPATVKWPSGSAPALTVAGTDLLVFLSDDNGATWRGAMSIKDAR